MPPLFFLHGLGGGHAVWEAQIAYFSSLGYRCTAWDQPGYGAAPLVEPYSLETVAAALEKALPAEPVVLIGHSMGGLIAQEAYARFPGRIRALALCFTSAAFVGGGEFARQFVAARIAPLDQGKSMAEVAGQVMPQMRGSRSNAQALETAIRIMSRIPPNTYRKAVELITTFDRRAGLASIAVPALLVAGSDDRTAPPAIMEKMARAIPRATYRLLEGCGHLGQMDQPAQFNAVLEDFLSRL